MHHGFQRLLAVHVAVKIDAHAEPKECHRERQVVGVGQHGASVVGDEIYDGVNGEQGVEGYVQHGVKLPEVALVILEIESIAEEFVRKRWMKRAHFLKTKVEH